MRIEDVRELKQEASEMIQREMITLAITDQSGWKCPPALGIHPVGKNDFQLAIRLRNNNDFPKNSVYRLRQKALQAGSDIDIKVVGDVFFLQDSLSHEECKSIKRPLCPGLSIGQSGSKSAGTLGCFVRKRNDNSLFLLSNAHVIAQPASEVGISILQPGELDGGIPQRDHIASLTEMSTPARGVINYIDAAIARIVSPDGIDPCLMHGVERLRGFHRDYSEFGELRGVVKTGRTTGTTRGTVTALELDVTVTNPQLKFEKQIEITGFQDTDFALPGDSGSLVVDDNGMAVGLIFACSQANTAYANPIGSVFDYFSVDILRDS